mgnify:CR=1 FL=1
MAKAFAGRAGLIACSERLREFIKYNALPAIFSSSLLPHDIAGLSKTLDLVRLADDKRARLHANADYLRRHLDALGYNVDISQAQIIALEAGPEPQTIVLRDALESRGVFGSVFCAPATATKPKSDYLSESSASSLISESNSCSDAASPAPSASSPSNLSRRVSSCSWL